MRHWERFLLIGLSLAVLVLLARATLEPEARALAPDGDARRDIAVCAMPSIINELMQSERFLPERENAAPDIRKRMDDLREELRDLEDSLRNADEDDPGAQRDRQRAREAVREFQSLRQELSDAIERKTAEQLAAAYNLVRSSAAAVAEDLGFDYVISTGDPEERLSTVDSEVTLRQITARPVLRAPDGVDITEDVRDDLNLE